jgi:hypothetical protein
VVIVGIQKQVGKFNIIIKILRHVLAVVSLSPENRKAGKFHLDLQVSCTDKC